MIIPALSTVLATSVLPRRMFPAFIKHSMHAWQARVCAALLAVTIVAPAALAYEPSTVADERLIAICVHRSARGKPWLAEALMALRYKEGGWIGAQVRNRDGSYDLGPMQINNWWVPRLAKLLDRSPVKVEQWLRQDACFNVEAARYILLNELDRSGDIWIAIGQYHSQIWRRQREYIVAVSRQLKYQRYAEKRLNIRSWSHSLRLERGGKLR